MPADGTIVAERKSARQPDSTPVAVRTDGLINLNRATAAELEALPRIGPKIAGRILAYREAHGPFQRVQDLTDVRGIGEKTLARLEPLVTVAE